jgi:hypothetical protein
MELHAVISALRRNHATLDQIDLVLGLIELDALDTVFFEGNDDEWRIEMALSFVRTRIREFQAKYLCEGTRDEFLVYLASHKEFLFDPNELRTITQQLKKQGEGTYGFKKISRMDEGRSET